jgi:hypothetical protein
VAETNALAYPNSDMITRVKSFTVQARESTQNIIKTFFFSLSKILPEMENVEKIRQIQGLYFLIFFGGKSTLVVVS